MSTEALYPQMAWFTGVVEDRDDPLEIGRLRVRINGYHNESKSLVPTEDLPWAHVIQPITTQSLDGVGRSPTGANIGTNVVGFFSDGAESCQEPIIMGTIGGINTSTGESDTPRLARSKGIIDTDTFEEVSGKEINKLDTILVDKLENATTDKKNRFEEPKPTYAGTYPNNHVWQTEGGHVIEVDDTEGAERLHTYHKSGTYEEIGPSGERITKIVGTDWEIIVSDKNLYVDGNFNTILTGNESVVVNGDSDVTIDGGSSVLVKGNSTITVLGGTTITSIGDMDVSAPNINVRATEQATIDGGGLLILKGEIVTIN